MQMPRIRATAGAVATAVAALLVAGCAPGQVVNDEPQRVQTLAPEDFAGLSLSYMYFTDGPDEQATRDLIAAFEDEYDVTVDLEVLPFADLVTAIQNRLSSGNGPDVARLTSISDFQDDVLVLDPYLGSDYVDEFQSGPTLAVTNADGELVGVPSDLTLNGPFINVDLFEEAGVEVPTADDPWTWDEMIAAGQAVKEASGAPYAFAVDKSGHRLSTVLSQYGTYLVGEGGNTLDIDKAEAALQPLVDMMADDDMPRDFWLGSGSRYQGANEIFLAGEAPIYLSGSWQVGQFAANVGFDWVVAPNPIAEVGGGFPGGKFLVGFRESENPALTAEFIRFMNAAENQEEFVTVGGQLPTRQDLADGGVTYANEQTQIAMDTFLSDLAETPIEGFAAAANPAFTGASTALVSELSKVVAGQKDLRTALTDLSAEIDALVSETSR